MRHSFGVLMLAAALLAGCAGQPAAETTSAGAAATTPAASASPRPTVQPTPTPTVEELLASLSDLTSAETRAWAAEYLAHVQDPAVVPALVGALDDDDVAVRIASVTSLGALGGAVGAQAVAAALQSELKAKPSSAFVSAACGALGQMRRTAGVAALISVLGTADKTNRDDARAALKSIGAPAVPALQKALDTGGRDQRLQVVTVLFSLGRLGLEPLITALGNSDAKVRSAAANRLGYLGYTAAAKPLAAMLTDSGIGNTASVALVRLFEKEPSKVVSYLTSTRTLRVYYGLLRLGAPETVDALATALIRRGDLEMAKDFLNCGEPTLEQAARDWAGANGYEVYTRYGTSDETWASGLPE